MARRRQRLLVQVRNNFNPRLKQKIVSLVEQYILNCPCAMHIRLILPIISYYIQDLNLQVFLPQPSFSLTLHFTPFSPIAYALPLPSSLVLVLIWV
ncbi:hypothetical protein DL98DRAFT_7067 [Cadophora sp. DSE1049]|nr:hypothetical protein DL98DRAFT_7067 [Cadophora sp. DSE1049]